MRYSTVIPGSRWSDDIASQDRALDGHLSVGDVVVSYAVASDGVGSHDGSQLAAELAVRIVDRAFADLESAWEEAKPTQEDIEGAVRQLVAELPGRFAKVFDLISTDCRVSEDPLYATLLLAVVVGSDAEEGAHSWAAGWICGDGSVFIGQEDGSTTTHPARGEPETLTGRCAVEVTDDFGRCVPCTTMDLALEGRGVPKRMSGRRRGMGLRLAAESRGRIFGVAVATDGLKHHEEVGEKLRRMLQGEDPEATTDIMSGAWETQARSRSANAKAFGSYVDDFGIAVVLR